MRGKIQNKEYRKSPREVEVSCEKVLARRRAWGKGKGEPGGKEQQLVPGYRDLIILSLKFFPLGYRPFKDRAALK